MTNSPNRGVDPETRDDILDRDNHRCQTCGKTDETRNGPATLEVHHIDRSVTEIDEHDPENLITLCQSCHNWQHKQVEPDDVDFSFCEEAKEILLPHDYELLQLLTNHGPATTGSLTNGHSADLTRLAIRERLWILMGLDNLVDARHRQLVDQNPNTGEWGLGTQISHSARGHIPEKPKTLITRAQDERVRRALNSGCPRKHVAAAMGVRPRTTHHMERRAVAYEFPLDRVIEDRGLHSVDLSDRLSDTIGEGATALPTDADQSLEAVAETAESRTPPYDCAEKQGCESHTTNEVTATDTELTLITTLEGAPDDLNPTELIQDLSLLAEAGYIEQVPPASPSMTYRVTTSGWNWLQQGLTKLIMFEKARAKARAMST